ncbi:hypothetical protein EX30DRAFT_375758 [Ascodesmis nigricans]|uniref:Uncharacterized protein n=1 Tax=Ascodesmis nigricans TaxID=341454 RepID=A0A4S2MLY9_9PEZI|nr:hypothetical protein EX30DRAFT_375758 [Ascodesmis nigricans]
MADKADVAAFFCLAHRQPPPTTALLLVLPSTSITDDPPPPMGPQPASPRAPPEFCPNRCSSRPPRPFSKRLELGAKGPTPPRTCPQGSPIGLDGLRVLSSSTNQGFSSLQILRAHGTPRLSDDPRAAERRACVVVGVMSSGMGKRR